jgi:putative tryptophan/tyrosine transport system ATP-binding protein
VRDLLQIQNLSKTFHPETINEKKVFQSFSLNIHKGDFVTIIGSNGAGKSTLLNLITGSVRQDRGEIYLKNKEISKWDEYKRTKHIGRVFQDPSLGTSPKMTLLENLSMAFNKGKKFNLSSGVSKKDISYFKEILEELSLGLENRMHSKVGLLSGGQRQSLALLMATITNPEVLLLDEHTAALDPKTSERISSLTKKIVEESGITTLMVTHNLNQAIEIGNRILMLHEGKVILDCKGEEKKNLTMEKLLSYFQETKSKDLMSDEMLFSFGG